MNCLGKTVFFILLWVLVFPPQAPDARVVVFDAATGLGNPVVIRIQTRGKVFSAGGEMAEVTVGDRPAGKVLTGADGFGYLKFTPSLAGVHPITARSGMESGRGLLLAADPEEPILLVEIDGPIRRLPKLTSTVEGAAESLRSLSDDFRIVYIAGMPGAAMDRAWLNSVDMPEAVVLSWNRGNVLQRLRDKGLFLRAAVGTRRLLEAAEGIVPLRFGFETDETVRRVKTWQELEKKLRRPD